MPHVQDLSGSALDDRYELLAVIGEGAFGRVYEGRDRRLERPVAVKVIKPWWADDPDWVAEFERETRMLARVSDPGIVQIFDVGNAPEGRYYVSELVRGENLAQRLRRGPLAPWKAADLAAQLCRALASAHAQRIVHRDVKPPNILLSLSGQVKVGDFGVAGLAEGSSGGGSQTIVGTPAYMAPEQSRGRAVTPATDVYSAGIVLYEMVAGRRPFEAASAVDLALCHLQDPPPPLPAEVPDALDEIITRALAKDPSRRYADGGEMADALVDARRSAAQRARGHSLQGAGLAGSRSRRRAGARPAETAVVAGAGRSSTALLEPTPPRPRRQAPPTPPSSPPSGGVPRADDTRPAPKLSPRSAHNPAGRRRAIAALVAAFALVGAMAAAAVVIGPGLGLGGTPAVAKSRVPDVTGMSAAAATATLKRHHLRAHAVTVPWPGHAAGTVRSQSPHARRLAHGSLVTLKVAEAPSWKTVESFDSTTSPVFRVRGSRFRLVYNSDHEKSCTLWVFCSRTGVAVTDASTGGDVYAFDLTDGNHEQLLDTGPGVYQVKVDPASGDSRWTFTVQDWY